MNVYNSSNNPKVQREAVDGGNAPISSLILLIVHFIWCWTDGALIDGQSNHRPILPTHGHCNKILCGCSFTSPSPTYSYDYPYDQIITTALENTSWISMVWQFPFSLRTLPQSFLTNCTAALLSLPFLFWRESSSLSESRRTEGKCLRTDDGLEVRRKPVNVASVPAGNPGEGTPQWDETGRHCSKAQIETGHRLCRLLPQSVACMFCINHVCPTLVCLSIYHVYSLLYILSSWLL